MEFLNTPLKLITRFARAQWLKFSLLAVASVVWAVNEAFLPYFLKQMVNALHASTLVKASALHASTLVKASALHAFWMIVGLWSLSELFLRWRGFTESAVYPVFRAQIREAAFQYTLSHSHRYFSEHLAGSLAKKLNDLPDSCQRLVEISLLDCLTAASGAGLILILSWFTQPVFTGILLLWSGLHLSLTGFFLRRNAPLWRSHAEAVSTLHGRIVDVLTNILSVRLFARRKHELANLERCQAEEIAQAKQALWGTEVMRLWLGLNSGGFILGTLAVLWYGWRRGWVTLGDFTQIAMQAFWLLQWAWFLTFQCSVLVREYGVVSGALSLIRKSHEQQDKQGAPPLRIHHGALDFKSVFFEYQKGIPVFQALNVHIPGGQKVGLVGFSGAGKSSFVNLLLRLYEPKKGHILIDGQAVSEVSQDSLRTQIAMIPQEPMLFHRTLMENIRYGCLTANDTEVIEAAKKAHCHEFIEQLPESYQALVGERGIKLSGGQRQRIAIARAILKNAPILILDEATAALDSVTEQLIQDSLRQLMQGRTILVIAHRLSTLSRMDRILVFHEGRIVEDGTQAELLKNKGYFTQFITAQHAP